MSEVALGIDFGGSGIKGAPVDLTSGALVAERLRIPTPEPATPHTVAEVVAQIVEHFRRLLSYDAIGVTVPAVVTHGLVRTAANIDASWIGTDAGALFSARIASPVYVVNDADAAGVAEARFGAARDSAGLVVVTTLGTGIGSALLFDGALIPNSELGHLQVDGHDAETRAASAARESEGLSWREWADRLQRYYGALEDLLWPTLIVVGGGVSKKADKFLPLLHLRAPIVAAQLRNEAGTVGAAVLAAEQLAASAPIASA